MGCNERGNAIRYVRYHHPLANTPTTCQSRFVVQKHTGATQLTKDVRVAYPGWHAHTVSRLPLVTLCSLHLSQNSTKVAVEPYKAVIVLILAL